MLLPVITYDKACDDSLVIKLKENFSTPNMCNIHVSVLYQLYIFLLLTKKCKKLKLKTASFVYFSFLPRVDFLLELYRVFQQRKSCVPSAFGVIMWIPVTVHYCSLCYQNDSVTVGKNRGMNHSSFFKWS